MRGPVSNVTRACHQEQEDVGDHARPSPPHQGKGAPPRGTLRAGRGIAGRPTRTHRQPAAMRALGPRRMCDGPHLHAYTTCTQLVRTSEAHTKRRSPCRQRHAALPTHPPTAPPPPRETHTHAPHMQQVPLTTSKDAQHGTPRRPTTDEQGHTPHPRLAHERGRTPHNSHTTACALHPTHPATAESKAPTLGLHQRSLPLLVGQTHHCPHTACHMPRCRRPGRC